MVPTVGEILSDHVSLSVSCIDRLYINGYVPKLQTSGQLAYFLRNHLGKPVASPAVLGQIGDRFRRDVKRFTQQHGVPVERFVRGQRKDDVAARMRRKYPVQDGVVFLGTAQERCRSFKATKRTGASGGVSFDFSRQSVFVNHLYFYVQDLDWGPAFVKMGTYVPYPIKLCLNGHEWVKQQLRRENIGFESLDNGFLSCEDPVRLQQLCDRLGPDQIQAFFDRWVQRLPGPLRPEDRDAGYRHQLSLWQIELSLTHVFDRPVNGRFFFDQVLRGNLDLGRPERIRLLFPRRLTKRTPPPRHGYRTRVITSDVNPSLHVEYKHSHVKQYFKLGRALRTETTINDPTDFDVRKGLSNMWQLKQIGNHVNERLLETERIAEDCSLDTEEFDQLQQSVTHGKDRISALRFGDVRVMALFSALCIFGLQTNGFRNRDLRRLVESLLGPYSAGQMTYDLRRLRRRGLIRRRPGTYRYDVTHLGLRVAYLYSKLHRRILQPAWAALIPSPTTTPHVARAVRTLDRHLDDIETRARLKTAA